MPEPKPNFTPQQDQTSRDQKNLGEFLKVSPELVEAIEKASRSQSVELIKTKKSKEELSVDLKEYYEKNINNKEWLEILSVYPQELQRKIIDKRPDGTPENITEVKERLNEEWARASELFIDGLYTSQGVELEHLLTKGGYGREKLNTEDEVKINEIVSNTWGWFDQFASVYGYKTEIYPDEDVRQIFGIKGKDINEVPLEDVRKNKDWYEKVDFFVEQYFKFFAAGTEENKLELAVHFLEFAEYFKNKTSEIYFQNVQFLQKNLDSQKMDDKVREFTPMDIEGSNNMTNILWLYGNQKHLRYMRILPKGYDIQQSLKSYSKPTLEVSSRAKELYSKYLKAASFENQEQDIEHFKNWVKNQNEK